MPKAALTLDALSFTTERHGPNSPTKLVARVRDSEALTEPRTVGWITADTTRRYRPLGANREPVIVDVYVAPEFRRQGIATELLATLRRALPNVIHDCERTIEGQAWAQSTGDELPPWKPIAW